MFDNGGLVRKHDQYQVELKLGYDLHPHHPRERYRVDTYFFIPENFDVNESTYPKQQFYRDLLLYIRFRTPDFTLSTLTDTGSERSPLTGVALKLSACRANPTVENGNALDYEMRLLGCVIKNSLRLQTRSIDALIEIKGGHSLTPEALAQAEALLKEFLVECQRITERFRELRVAFQNPILPHGVAATYAFTDEFLSLLVEESAHQLLERLQDRTEEPLRQSALSLARLIRGEIAHRHESKYPSLVNELHENETFLFRLSVLKKFIGSALHLSVRMRSEGKGIEHLLLAMGAGFAMLFATTVAFYYQRVYGTLSLGFFVILIVSYMFKDRMKALSQARLQHWLSKNLYDQSTSIFDPLNRKKIGVCREAMSFTPEKRVDPMALSLRNRDHITEIENTWRAEKVIHYTKEITLFSNRFLKTHTRKTGITDILRFSLRNFLVKMDEPLKEIYALKDGRTTRLTGTRVYHVNIVLRFMSETETRYERIRLVLNRDGIKRIEPLGAERAPGKDSFYSSPLRPM